MPWSHGRSMMGFSSYDSRPWLARYASGYPTQVEPKVNTLVEAFTQLVQQSPNHPQIDYFGEITTRHQLENQADLLAAFLADQGFSQGDRLAIYAQRSEEHTSELQSRFDLVCRLL